MWGVAGIGKTLCKNRCVIVMHWGYFERVFYNELARIGQAFFDWENFGKF